MMEHSEHKKPGDLCLMERKDISHRFLGADTTESTHPQHPPTRGDLGSASQQHNTDANLQDSCAK